MAYWCGFSSFGMVITTLVGLGSQHWHSVRARQEAQDGTAGDPLGKPASAPLTPTGEP
ncbi:MAG: hypothetical protein E6924_09605 [Cutibacterium avidum]|nr:hypothetical protein [Cutibacterium avidum]